MGYHLRWSYRRWRLCGTTQRVNMCVHKDFIVSSKLYHVSAPESAVRGAGLAVEKVEVVQVIGVTLAATAAVPPTAPSSALSSVVNTVIDATQAGITAAAARLQAQGNGMTASAMPTGTAVPTGTGSALVGPGPGPSKAAVGSATGVGAALLLAGVLLCVWWRRHRAMPRLAQATKRLALPDLWARRQHPRKQSATSPPEVSSGSRKVRVSCKNEGIELTDSMQK